MKKNIILILLFFTYGFINGQHRKVKQKQKTTVVKDTVKKEVGLIDQKNENIDTTSIKTNFFKPYKKGVHASYYSDKLNGKRTASGIKFDNNKYTAAHKKFPFGTKLRITNETTGKSVIVEVIDRGPFVKEREIDITRKAYKEIAECGAGGGIIVKIEVEEK